MRTRCLRFMLLFAAVIGWSARGAAQDVPTVFIHGLASSNATWQGAADRLKARVAIAPQRPNLNWRDKFENQASSLQGALGGLPGSTIAVGHSNGGLVARQWSRLHPVSGIVTLGTPNQGAPLAYNALRWLNFNFAASSVITEVFNAYARNCCTWNGTLAQLQNWIYYVRYWLSLEATGLAATIGIDTTAPVLAQMASGSPAGLNSSANLSREASAVPARVGIGIVAHNFYYAGPFRAMWPEDGDTIASWMSTTVNTLNYFAAYIADRRPGRHSSRGHRQLAHVGVLIYLVDRFDLVPVRLVGLSLDMQPERHRCAGLEPGVSGRPADLCLARRTDTHQRNEQER